MAVFLSPAGGVAAQFFTSTGAVLTGGKLFTYLAGTTTSAATYTTSQGNVAWTNPIVLDAAGRVPGSGEIWLTDGVLYKFVLKDANDVLIATYDNINGINSGVDASLVSYDPPFIRSVATNVEAKLSEYVSVKDFGAVGDGVADDTAAIQAAIDSGASIYFPNGTFKINSSITIDVSNVNIYGAGRDQSIIQASGAFPVFEFGNDPLVTNISNFVLKNLAVQNGTYGLYASRAAGSFLTLERFFIDDVSVASQSTAGLYFTGSQLGYFVNNITNTAFRYCGRGFVLDDVFSANLNHINLCRFEGNAGHGIKISTTNQECSLLTIEKCRFEAITTEAAINITGGTQTLSVKENYFEDCPAGVMEFDAGAGLNVSTLIESNNVSSNAIPANVITFSSQCINTSIVNNTFRQGAGPATITGNAFCTGFNVYGNQEINFTGFTASFNAFAYYDQIDGFRRYNPVKNHSGTFTYDFTLPQEGMYNVQVSLLDDGDISLGGVAYFLITWITGGAPILDAYTVRKVLNSDTTDIAATVDSAGKVTVTFTKATATSRTAYIYFSYSNLVVTP